MVKLKRDYNREESFKEDLKAKKPKTKKKKEEQKKKSRRNVVNSIENCTTFTR